MTNPLLSSALFTLCALGPLAGSTGDARPYDMAIVNGRVIDPESGLDAVRNIGIRGDRIVSIGTQPVEANVVIDARGLVVSPGFVDLHRHAHGDNSYRFAVQDGVTSAFEIEVGAPDVEAWYRMLGPARLINFGVGAGHIGARMQVLGDPGFMLPTGPGRGPATPAQIADILRVVGSNLDAGGVAVGMGVAYTPGASDDEVAALFRLAARHGAFVFAHLGGDAAGLERTLALAGQSRAALHVAHVNSTAGAAIDAWLGVMRAARERMQDVTTEIYPYTAGASLIQSALFDRWEEWPDERFASFQWAASGEFLTRETFGKFRASGGSVINHANKEEWLRVAIADPLAIFASDGGRDADDNPTHPRAAGTFSRILGKYVREERLLSLPDALRRITLEPARRLESRVPEMRDRGRLRKGAYADVTIFDPATIEDRATYVSPASHSVGVRHVIVNGIQVVRDGALATHATLQGQRVRIGEPLPGRPIRAPRTP